MTPEKVLQMLKEYRECLGRAEYLAHALVEKRNERSAIMRTMVADEISISPVLSGMPHSSNIEDPTSKLAIKLADGYVPKEVRELDAEIRKLSREVTCKCNAIACVNAWLTGLNDKERWIIEKHVIDGAYWREIAYSYGERFGDMYTRDGLKKIKKAALSKIYRMAE